MPEAGINTALQISNVESILTYAVLVKLSFLFLKQEVATNLMV